MSKTNNAFLPEDYTVPSPSNNYMKFEEGANTFRALDSVIVGYLGWKTTSDGARKPVRARSKDGIKPGDVDVIDEVKHFWAFPVWNYKTEAVQILEIAQRSIQQAIGDLIRDEDWGIPVGVDGYDIVVTRKGEGMETRYSVMPKPHKKLDEGIMQFYSDMHIKLDALYTGDDPFQAEESINTDDIPDF